MNYYIIGERTSRSEKREQQKLKVPLTCYQRTSLLQETITDQYFMTNSYLMNRLLQDPFEYF
jgi:hypothetical protein